MPRTLQYEKMLVELAIEMPIILRGIMDALQQAPNGLTRKELIRAVLHEEPQSNLANDTRDRKIRKGIEALRNMGFPIVSTSGKAGYKLDTNPENIKCMIGELKSRIAHLQQKVDALQRFHDLLMERSQRNEP